MCSSLVGFTEKGGGDRVNLAEGESVEAMKLRGRISWMVPYSPEWYQSDFMALASSWIISADTPDTVSDLNVRMRRRGTGK